MRSSRLTSLALLLSAGLLPAPPGMAQSPEARRVDVRFDPGTSRAMYRDAIRGYETLDYILHAESGQRLVVDYSSNNPSGYVNVYAPGKAEAMHVGSTVGDHYEGTLPATGDYRVQVYLMRNAARRDETGQFTLVLEKSGGSDYVDGLAGGPDFWAVTLESGRQLNVRSGPATGQKVVARLADGTLVRNLGCAVDNGSRWCRVGLLKDEAVAGWVDGRFLKEAAGPGSGGGGGTTIPGNAERGVPELFVRSTGEIEVRWEGGCTALYRADGTPITAGSSCSTEQRRKSTEAVAAHQHKQP